METKNSKHKVEELDQVLGLATGKDTTATDAQKQSLKDKLGVTDLELKVGRYYEFGDIHETLVGKGAYILLRGEGKVTIHKVRDCTVRLGRPSSSPVESMSSDTEYSFWDGTSIEITEGDDVVVYVDTTLDLPEYLNVSSDLFSENTIIPIKKNTTINYVQSLPFEVVFDVPAGIGLTLGEASVPIIGEVDNSKRRMFSFLNGTLVIGNFEE